MLLAAEDADEHHMVIEAGDLRKDPEKMCAAIA